MLAKMALQFFQKHHTETESNSEERPDLETLIAFYKNELTKKDRNTVISYIANDPETYQQWITLVESEAEFKEVPKPKRLNNLVVVKKRNIIDFFNYKLANWGGALVAACFTLALFLTLPNHGQLQYTNVSALYQTYSVETKPSLPTRRYMNNVVIDLNNEQLTSTLSGIGTGLTQLGNLFSIKQITVEKLSNNGIPLNPPKAQKLQPFFIAGYLATITYFHCENKNANQAFFLSANKILWDKKKIFEPILTNSTEIYSTHLNDRVRACLFTETILKPMI